mmetsp:Transcript_8042/g.25652  ORF Transcript_8042/g.25652 Transcript_8042/m.25652 type:complete len:225 (+) Transcript_8042:93-767(+)
MSGEISGAASRAHRRRHTCTGAQAQAQRRRGRGQGRRIALVRGCWRAGEAPAACKTPNGRGAPPSPPALGRTLQPGTLCPTPCPWFRGDGCSGGTAPQDCPDRCTGAGCSGGCVACSGDGRGGGGGRNGDGCCCCVGSSRCPCCSDGCRGICDGGSHGRGGWGCGGCGGGGCGGGGGESCSSGGEGGGEGGGGTESRERAWRSQNSSVRCCGRRCLGDCRGKIG